MPKRLRNILINVHLYTGLTLGLYLVVMGLTGSALVFKHDLAGWLNPDLHRVEPAGERLPISQVVAGFRERHPDAEITRIYPPTEPGGTYCFWIGPWQGDQPRVYVDPFRGSVVGEHAYAGSLIGWIEYLHFALHGGMVGFAINAYLALATLALLATGLVLWWPRRLTQLGRGLWIKWRARPLRVNWDVHNALGVWALPVLALLCLTGAAFEFAGPLQSAVRWVAGEPAPPAAEPYEPPETGRPQPLDVLVAQARAALPGSTLALVMNPDDVRRPLLIYVHPRGDEVGHWWIGMQVDRYDGNVIDIHSYEDSAADLVKATIFPLHAGSIGGIALRIAWLVAGLVPAVLMITGVVMWWQRRRGRKRRKRVRRNRIEPR